MQDNKLVKIVPRNVRDLHLLFFWNVFSHVIFTLAEQLIILDSHIKKKKSVFVELDMILNKKTHTLISLIL